MSRALLGIVLVVTAWLVAAPASAQDAELLAALRAGGHVGLMRHARAPGNDDPPNFSLGDCATQRNLSSGGREQARAVGLRLREAGLASVRLVSSQWCRCIDTAELLDLGPLEQVPFFNSLVSYPRESAQMTRDARDWILAQDWSALTIVVTHQVNIGALVRAYPAEGEIVVVRRAPEGTLEVVGTIGVD